MLKLSATLQGLPIISLRTGGAIGKSTIPLINPNNLKIEALYCTSIYEKHTVLLPSPEIREISRLGIAVNDHVALTNPEDLIRLKEFIAINYTPIGKLVITENGKKVGKVEDYAVDLDSLYIVNLYVNPRAFKSLTQPPLTINRQQIVEITDKRIIVSDVHGTVKVGATLPAAAQP